MTLPSTTLNRVDGSLGFAPPDLSGVHVAIGTSSAGTENDLVGASTPDAFVDAFGSGKMVEAAVHSLVHAGGPIYGMRVETDVPGEISDFEATLVDAATGTIVDDSSAPYDAYSIRIEITRTGTLGTGAFRYSLDGQDTYSPEIAIPLSGDYTIEDSGISITFVPGGGAVYFEEGDVHDATTTAPHYTTTALEAALDALHADNTEWEFLHLCGTPAPQTSSVTESNPAGPNITVTGTPTVWVDVIVEIMLGGALLTATYRYSLDGGATYTDAAVTPAATFEIPNTGLTLNFAAGTYVLGNTYTFHTWTSIAALASLLSTKLTEFNTASRYVFGVMETPSDIDDDILKLAFANFVDPLVTVAAGDAEITSSIDGKILRRSSANLYCARLSKISISIDPAETDPAGEAGGALPSSCLSIYRDEYVTPSLDEARFTTLRTEVEIPGFWVTNGNTMAPLQSDYSLQQNVRVINAGSRVARRKLFTYQSKRIPLDTETGLIDEVFARTVDKAVAKSVKDALGDNIIRARFVTNRTDNIASTKHLRGKLYLLPYAYAKEVSADIGFENPALGA